MSMPRIMFMGVRVFDAHTIAVQPVFAWEPLRMQGISALSMCTHSKSCGVLLTTAIVKVQSDNGIELLVRALVGPYSQASVISGPLYQRLNV